MAHIEIVFKTVGFFTGKTQRFYKNRISLENYKFF